MTGWRLLLTRPTDESTALAAVLAEAGIFSSALPLLEIEPLAVDGAGLTKILNLPFYAAAIVVSKPAARLGLDLVDQYWPQPPLLPWFTVGAATAQLLDDYGLRVDYPADGDDSEALLDLPALQEALAQPDPRVLILRGEGGRELLAERLRGQGASVDYLELYRRCLPAYAEGTLVRRIRAERLNGLVVSSGQGFEHLQQLARADWPEVARLPLFVPSPRVAQMARAAGAQHVVDCRGANATALLAALRESPVPAF
ncbi:uroporphyrinogen-III synthase [Pseudomonas gingeri]|uniref:uroporphyrinogen-III synthase n=1 Tax=Pseudomonas gingeri TaxID=117681 RepID=UPI0015A33989|nr:uroporphyrinogen-III synthase [Pseudomonas gingeri]NWA04276.1 uroporphyrinogen-III synthase [Pseudomonas gingeri]NWA15149.1 uroporphyrinogen-III synthase [Pseudomonas gingeri]NWA54590.1 uroporphyrinogen-III synthase [Pseudomonas gingeri]NWA98347.1 uroporphyrinogen-III synthase [Pseudomonas gingeri]NWB04139.1 uroporphyrinogen-III synthase [Pseudomonas gingeri]